MPNIIIVEDEEIISIGLEKIIRSIDNSINVLTTAYAEEAFELATKNEIDAFLLDIQLKDYNGLELAKQLRELEEYKLTPMVFITAVPTRELMPFKEVHCYDYIVKPFTEGEVRKVFETIIKYGLKEEEKVIKIDQKGFFYVIKERDIICIEANGRKVSIITEQENIATNRMLKNIKEELSNDFIQCHKSFLINKNHVKTIDKKKAVISFDGIDEEVPYGRKYKDEIERCLNVTMRANITRTW